MTEKQSLTERIVNLDIRIILLLVTVFICIPIIKPLGLPLVMTEHTMIMYNTVESLEPDAIVFGEISLPLGAASEAIYTGEAIMKHLFMRNIKQVWVSLTADGELEYEMMIEAVQPEKMGRQYGVDWVYLGYVAGQEEVVCAALADDVWKTVPVDYYGNSLEDLPLMARVKSSEDWDLIVSSAGVTSTIFAVVRQWGSVYKVPIYIYSRPINAPLIYPYFPDLVKAILPGIRSSAEYEILIKWPSTGASTMDAMNIALLSIAILIIIRNILYFITKYQKGGKV